MGEQLQRKMTVEEFFEWQLSQDKNYELVDGVPVLTVKAMTGATSRHDTVTVNGRNALSWEEKFALDTWYVDNRSFWLDLKIILMTAASLVRPRGISAEGSATMHEFMGSEAAPPPQPAPPEPARRFP